MGVMTQWNFGYRLVREPYKWTKFFLLKFVEILGYERARRKARAETQSTRWDRSRGYIYPQ